MPASKNRHPHKHTHQRHTASNTPLKPKKANRVVIIAVIFFSVLGLCIGLFIDAVSITTVLTSAVLGAAAGFFAGYLVNKSLTGK